MHPSTSHSMAKAPRTDEQDLSSASSTSIPEWFGNLSSSSSRSPFASDLFPVEPYHANSLSQLVTPASEGFIETCSFYTDTTNHVPLVTTAPTEMHVYDEQYASGRRSRRQYTLRTVPSDPMARRREQNRVSQRAYRQRKEDYIKALEIELEIIRSERNDLSNLCTKQEGLVMSLQIHLAQLQKGYNELLYERKRQQHVLACGVEDRFA